jgi:hypothetical protein
VINDKTIAAIVLCTVAAFVPSTVCAQALLAAAAAQAVAEPVECALAGVWLSDDRTQKVQFVSSDGTWSGRLVWASQDDAPVGAILFRHFVYDTKTQRYRGELVRPVSTGGGKATSAEMQCTDGDTVTVSVSRMFRHKSIVWHRTNDPTHGVHSIDEKQPEPSPAGGSTSERKWWQRFNLSVGPGIGIDRLTDDAAGSDLDVGFTLVRRRGSGGMRSGFGMLGASHGTGFAPMFRFTLRPAKTATVPDLDANVTSYGDVTTRPVMAGLSWSHEFRTKWIAELSVVAGYSFNGFDANTDGAAATKGPRVVLPASVASVKGSFASEAGARLLYDLNSRIAFTTGVFFLRTRPEFTLTDGSTRSWYGDRLHAEAGLAFTLFGRSAKRR